MRDTVLPAVISLVLALTGCVATGPALPSPGGAPASAGLLHEPWWQRLGDVQLSALIERALATTSTDGSWPTSARTTLSCAVASRYTALRAEQTALVLLAARAQLDRQQGAAAAVRTDQARARSAIATLRESLAVLTGLAPGVLDALPGGPIPLPPRQPGAMLAIPEIARYAAAHATADQAQTQAEHARSVAALADLRARSGILPPAAALAADHQALDALLTEEQARAAMTQAYVALAGWARRSSAGRPQQR